MKSPVTGKEMVLNQEKRMLTFRKEEFEVVYHHYLCVDSGETFTSTKLDDLNLNQLYNQFRVKHSLPFPDEIRRIREKYSLPASKMSEVLGFGANSYRNYESGEVPSQSNARLIQMANDPMEFKKLVLLSNAFDGSALTKLINKIDLIIQEEDVRQPVIALENYFLGTRIPDSITGYRIPSLEKLSEMVIYFSTRMQPFKTKLNKLLFYADFTMFSKSGFSISGVQYCAVPMGPVPNNFLGIFEYLANKDVIDVHSIPFPDGNTGEQFKPNPLRSFNPEVFSEEEMEVLNEIAIRFEKTSTSEMIDLSHKEKAWIENKDGHKFIDYNYGFMLNVQEV